MDQARKSLTVAPKLLARRSNAMWDILLANVEEAKTLAESILITKSVRLQIDRVPLGIS